MTMEKDLHELYRDGVSPHAGNEKVEAAFERAVRSGHYNVAETIASSRADKTDDKQHRPLWRRRMRLAKVLLQDSEKVVF